jgi:hypothetical protein
MRMPHRLSAPKTICLLLVAATALIGSRATPAAAQIPDKFENLKVLPKDITRDSLIQVMRGFALQLGVRCQFCHVTEPAPAGTPPGPNGAPAEHTIFKADDKVEKRTARFMLRMVDSLNHSILPTLPDRQNPPVVIECATCHRGSPLPQTLDMVLSAVINRYGVDSAVSRYKQLREDMVSGRYDFGEWSINELARTLAGTGKVTEAIAMLRMNQQYYPSSPDIDFQLGELYAKQGDKNQAIQCYRAVLTKRPDDGRAKRRLADLGASPTGE